MLICDGNAYALIRELNSAVGNFNHPAAEFRTILSQRSALFSINLFASTAAVEPMPEYTPMGNVFILMVIGLILKRS
jgi:hypothetical protein